MKSEKKSQIGSNQFIEKNKIKTGTGELMEERKLHK